VSANETTTTAQNPTFLGIAASLLASSIATLGPNLPTWAKLFVLAVAAALAIWAFWVYVSARRSEQHLAAGGQQVAPPSGASEERPAVGRQRPTGIRSMLAVLILGAALGTAITTIVVSIVGVGQRSPGANFILAR